MAERILVVDDEPGVRTALGSILADEGFTVQTVGSGEDGLLALERERFDAVLLDVWLPGIDGLETLERMKVMRPDAEVVMISGHGTIETAVRATKLGAFDFVEKPLSLERILLVLRNALRQRRLEQHNRRLLEQLSRETEIVGPSEATARLRADVEAAAAAEAPVLICGEPGSGRASVARRIHARGAAAEGPFVEVPCSALDVQAAGQALFGRGTGDAGRVALAAAGSLFLRDVHGLGLELQDRLAGALLAQARERRPARLLASSTAGGEELGPALRPLLDVLRIEVPSLRQRRDDVPSLAERFMATAAREYGRPARQLSPDCIEALKGYDWPGNALELRSLMERLLLTAPQEVIRADDLPEPLGRARGPLAQDLYREFASLDEGLRAFESYYVRRILAEEADPARAARRLGLSPADLERWREPSV